MHTSLYVTLLHNACLCQAKQTPSLISFYWHICAKSYISAPPQQNIFKIYSPYNKPIQFIIYVNYELKFCRSNTKTTPYQWGWMIVTPKTEIFFQIQRTFKPNKILSDRSIYAGLTVRCHQSDQHYVAGLTASLLPPVWYATGCLSHQFDRAFIAGLTVWPPTVWP